MPDTTTPFELSRAPYERIKLFITNIGAFYWNDPEKAEPLIRNLCGDLQRESELLILGLRAGIPDELQRTVLAGAAAEGYVSVNQVADHWAERDSLNRNEARWAATTIAASMRMVRMPKAGAAPAGDDGSYSPLGGQAVPVPNEQAAALQRADAPQGYSYQTQQPGAPQNPYAAAPPPPVDNRFPGAITAPPAANYSEEVIVAPPPNPYAQAAAPVAANPYAAAASAPHNPYATAAAAPANPYAAAAAPSNPYAAAAATPAVSANPYGAPPPPQSAPGSIGIPQGAILDHREAGYWPESEIPEEVDENQWCWSGFLGGIWWGYAHGMRLRRGAGYLLGVVVPVILISYLRWWFLYPLPYIGFHVVLGLRGNSIAWGNRTFNTKDHFRKVQKAWIIGGAILFLLECIGVGLRTNGLRQEAIFYKEMQSGQFGNDSLDNDNSPTAPANGTGTAPGGTAGASRSYTTTTPQFNRGSSTPK